MTGRVRWRVAVGVLVVGLAAACTSDDPGLVRDAPDSVTTVVDRPTGGVVRVAVRAEPDPADRGLGGAAVRPLVLPTLFRLRADGSWEPVLVVPGTVTEAPDLRSVTFRLRSDARWSDGTAISGDDLRRTMDARFVDRVDGPDAAGFVTLRFTQPLPEWRRLWSGVDAIDPPGPDVWGGPFVVAARTEGLETVLHPNPQWWGAGPFLDEVRLVLVPSVTTQSQLFERGELDVVAPPAVTARIRGLEAVEGATVAIGQPGGVHGVLVANPAELDAGERAALFATMDRDRFVDVLLTDEAVRAAGLITGVDAWPTHGIGDASGLRRAGTVEFVGFSDLPMTGLVQRAMQQRARDAGGTLELRTATADLAQTWSDERDYDALVDVWVDTPAMCWVCRVPWFDEDAARAADADEPGADLALSERLRDEAIVLPLWTEVPVIATRGGVRGVDPNGWSASAAWNAHEWWIEPEANP